MIPTNEPLISKNALKYVSECIESGWVSSSGKFINEFEKKFAEFVGTKFAITTTSGTTALHLALLSLDIKNGDEVIVPSHTMMSSAAAIAYVGAKPIFIDVNRDSWNINTELIESKINKKTKAIMPVHIYGLPVEMDSIMKIAKKHNLFVIEDAAESLGATYQGRQTGSIGNIGCFSFYANKMITTGEGGMITTNSEKFYQRAKLLKDLAHSPKKRFLHNEIGYNFRMTNLQAALGLAQLEDVKKHVMKKKWMAAIYSYKLHETEGLTLPIEHTDSTNVYWMYGLLIEDSFGISRNELAKELFKRGIDTRTFFVPMHQQPIFVKLGYNKNTECPISEEISERGLYLPSGLAITEKQINTVCNAIYEIKDKVTKT